jgi:hypothetical protein
MTLSRVGTALLLLFLLRGTSMATPKEDAEKLMNTLLPFAEKMLREYGEFYPYRGAMTPDGKVVEHAAYTGSEFPKGTEVIQLLTEAFQKDAADRKYIATAIIYDIRTIPPGESEKTDAVCVSLDHNDGYSVNIIFPYTLKHAELSLREPFATKGDGKIFPKK